jgi:hypothetical protein
MAAQRRTDLFFCDDHKAEFFIIGEKLITLDEWKTQQILEE